MAPKIRIRARLAHSAIGELAAHFLCVADCFGRDCKVEALRTSIAALAVRDAPSDTTPWLSAQPPLPKKAHTAAKRGSGALYAALRGLRSARLAMALRRWSVAAARAFLEFPSTNAQRLSLENAALMAELSSLKDIAQQNNELQAELRRLSQGLDQRLTEQAPHRTSSLPADPIASSHASHDASHAVSHHDASATPGSSTSGGMTSPGSPEIALSPLELRAARIDPTTAPLSASRAPVQTPRTPRAGAGGA